MRIYYECIHIYKRMFLDHHHHHHHREKYVSLSNIHIASHCCFVFVLCAHLFWFWPFLFWHIHNFVRDGFYDRSLNTHTHTATHITFLLLSEMLWFGTHILVYVAVKFNFLHIEHFFQLRLFPTWPPSFFSPSHFSTHTHRVYCWNCVCVCKHMWKCVCVVFDYIETRAK